MFDNQQQSILLEEEMNLGGSTYETSSTSVSKTSSPAPRTINFASSILSQLEMDILRSTDPIGINETEEITVLGNTGVWANRNEVINWKGDLDLAQYALNEDSDPEIITKKASEIINYVQELAVRYLKPPTPPVPGDIVIIQESNIVTGPAPPLIVRQQPARAETPEPLIVREAPPQPPQKIGQKIITISGKRLPPPPRKVVIERFAAIPSKPQNVIIERWLPYGEVKRRVIFNKPTAADPVVAKPRNVIIQWEQPEVNVTQQVSYLGVVNANPTEYVERYGDSLKLSQNLPDFVLNIATPPELTLAADYRQNSVHELEGEIEALKLIDLEKEGLGEYKDYIHRYFESKNDSKSSASFMSGQKYTSSRTTSLVSYDKIFAMIDKDKNGYIESEEAGKILLRLNSRFRRSYGEDELTQLFATLDKNGDGKLNEEEFKTAFEQL